MKDDVMLSVALSQQRYGHSVIPCRGKRPALRSWQEHQHSAADEAQIRQWYRAGLFGNIGIVCGYQNLVVIDLDGWNAVMRFQNHWKSRMVEGRWVGLLDTYTVLTGSGKGKHFYYYVTDLPKSISVGVPGDMIEIRAHGRYVVAPPSIHPETGNPYKVEKLLPIKRLETLEPVVRWLESLKPKPQQRLNAAPVTSGGRAVNRRLIAAIERILESKGYKGWTGGLYGRCIFHDHHDENPSFTFYLNTGWGVCGTCGTIRTTDICKALGIDCNAYGGLWEK